MDFIITTPKLPAWLADGGVMRIRNLFAGTASFAAISFGCIAAPISETAFDACSAQTNNETRLSCYDAIAAGRKAANSTAAAAPAAPLDGNSAPKSDTSDRIKAVIIAVAFSSGHAVVTLDNGQVFQQVDSDTSRFKGHAGDAVTVSSSFFGDYWSLVLNDRNGFFKMRRVR